MYSRPPFPLSYGKIMQRNVTFIPHIYMAILEIRGFCIGYTLQV